MDFFLNLFSLCTTRDKAPLDLDDDSRPKTRSTIKGSSGGPFGNSGSPYAAEQNSIGGIPTTKSASQPRSGPDPPASNKAPPRSDTSKSKSQASVPDSSRSATQQRREKRAKVNPRQEDVPAQPQPQPEPEPAKPSVVSALTNVFEKPTQSKPAPKPEVKTPSTVLKRSTSSSNPKCEVCGKTAYINESELDAKSNAYHKTCFKCSTCKKSLSGTAFCKHTDGRLYCNDVSGAGRGCYQRLQLRIVAETTDIVKGTDVKVEQDRSMPEGAARVADVMGVIGTQLEKSVGSMVPRCSVCSSTFSATDEILQFGAVRTHKGCLGKERSTSNATVTVREAAGLVEKVLSVRLQWCGRPKTFLFVTQLDAPVEMTNDRGVFEFVPDVSARADSSRLYDASMNDGVANIEGLGEWKHFKPVTKNALVDEDALTITQTLAAIKSGVLFSVTVCFAYDPTRAIVNSLSARLTLTKHTTVQAAPQPPISHARARPTKTIAPSRGGKRELSSDDEA